MTGVLCRERNDADAEFSDEIVETVDREFVTAGVDLHCRFEPGHRWHVPFPSQRDGFRVARGVGFGQHDRQQRRSVDDHLGKPFSSYIQLVSELTGSRMCARISLPIASMRSTV